MDTAPAALVPAAAVVAAAPALVGGVTAALRTPSVFGALSAVGAALALVAAVASV